MRLMLFIFLISLSISCKTTTIEIGQFTFNPLTLTIGLQNISFKPKSNYLLVGEGKNLSEAIKDCYYDGVRKYNVSVFKVDIQKCEIKKGVYTAYGIGYR